MLRAKGIFPLDIYGMCATGSQPCSRFWKMQAVHSFETSENYYPVTQSHIQHEMES